ncbi:tetratricopeptide repeat protein 21B-like isoform X1 [Dermacentor variabilis]|uniref:tetratricopeptide repeat protein 21B-like isoform X1 n=2 Tax=Dermacentor variabilis TaxID=34621 RepID=UPI003F5B0E27
MTEPELLLKTRIHYYCREKQYRSMQRAAVDGLKRYSGDAVYRLYFGMSLIFEGRLQEGIRELDVVRESKDVSLGGIMALIFAHRKCSVVDKEAVSQLDAQLKETRKQAGEKVLYYAGLFLFLTGKHDKAREYIDRMLKVAPPTREGLILKGWNEIVSTKDKKSAIQYFESPGVAVPEALFGKAKCFECSGELMKALEVVNQAVVLYTGFVPALLEKMKLHLALSDWEQMVDSCNRCLSQDSKCIDALLHLILNQICKNGDYKEASDRLSELVSLLEVVEPTNGILYNRIAQLLSRICSRQNCILMHTQALIEKACALQPANADYLAELGYQCILQNKTKEATKHYRAALKADEASITALNGIIWCQLLEGQHDVANQQLELLKEIHKTSSMPSELLYLCAMCAQKLQEKPEEVLNYLGQSVDNHFARLEGLPLGAEYLLVLNPDFIFEVVKLYLQYAPDKPVDSGQTIPEPLKRGQTILQPVLRSCPGSVEAVYWMGKLKYLSNDLVQAQSLLSKCTQQYSSFTSAQLLLAQMHIHQGNIKSASQLLETALSYDFEVREKPIFHIIKAKILKEQGDYQEALQLLNAAMALCTAPASTVSRKNRKQELTSSDKLSLYLELADVYGKLDQQHEAVRVMQEAANEFRGTSEETRVAIASCELALARGDVEEALSLLRNIGPDQPYFQQAREKMADIYLNYRKDPRLYASCYREIIEKFPVPQSYLMLGDAYMKIQEPDNAIGAYEQALRKNPKDSAVARKIGQALIKTHQFERAITYYKAAIKSGGQPQMKYDLAELLAKIKRYQDAEDAINAALGALQKEPDLTSLQWESKFYLLLAQVHQNDHKDDLSVKDLNKAFEAQSRVMLRVPQEQPDSLHEQRQLAIVICKSLAEHSELKRDYVPAARFYKQALSYDSANIEILLALAKLEMTSNNLESAKQYCNTVLQLEKNNDTATLMMADLMFRKTDLESSMFHFQQLLERKPDYYPALARLIEAMRRLGKLDQADQFLKKASNLLPRSGVNGGYFYCKGLHEWYTGNPAGAMKSFNKARYDPDWGLISTYHMIEICINPDNETIGGETFDNGGIITGDGAKVDYHEGAIQTAMRLLTELRPKMCNDSDFRLMSNFVLLAKKSKADAEIALNEFLQFSSEERNRDHVGAILGIATAQMILKQVPRARNQLKRVMKAPWNFGDAEYLEKCWILLADIYIQSGKYDVSTDLLKRVLQHNKSCTKAYEYMGYIMEKEQSYKDAAQYYENAWKQGSQNNPAIGYKLAFNYLKAKRYTDAIDVCHVVLAKYPSYPKIRKDILEKARANLRT